MYALTINYQPGRAHGLQRSTKYAGLKVSSGLLLEWLSDHCDLKNQEVLARRARHTNFQWSLSNLQPFGAYVRKRFPNLA